MEKSNISIKLVKLRISYSVHRKLPRHYTLSHYSNYGKETNNSSIQKQNNNLYWCLFIGTTKTVTIIFPIQLLDNRYFYQPTLVFNVMNRPKQYVWQVDRDCKTENNSGEFRYFFSSSFLFQTKAKKSCWHAQVCNSF